MFWALKHKHTQAVTSLLFPRYHWIKKLDWLSLQIQSTIGMVRSKKVATICKNIHAFQKQRFCLYWPVEITERGQYELRHCKKTNAALWQAEVNERTRKEHYQVFRKNGVDRWGAEYRNGLYYKIRPLLTVHWPDFVRGKLNPAKISGLNFHECTICTAI